jgi:HD-GYP domain-containing protein (c-di-GMP phosphodiesterase class II)
MGTSPSEDERQTTNDERHGNLARWRRAANYYSDHGLPMAAIEASEHWLRLARQADLVAGQVAALLTIASRRVFDLHWYEVGEAAASDALDLCARVRDLPPPRLATAYGLLGVVAVEQRQYARAVWALERMLAALDPLQERPPETLSLAEQRTLLRAFTNLSVACYQVNEYQRSLELAQRGLDLARRVNRWQAMLPLLHNLAEILMQMGRYQEAQRAVEEVERLIAEREVPDRAGWLGPVYGTHAWIEFRCGRLATAWSYTLQALDCQARKMFGRERLPFAEASYLLGLLYLTFGEGERGVTCLKRAERLFRSLGLHYRAAEVQSHLAVHPARQNAVEGWKVEGSRLEGSEPATCNLQPATGVTLSGVADAERRFLVIGQVLDQLFALHDRFPPTADHTERTVGYSLILAERLNLSPREKEAIAYVGPLHDLGKINVPAEILEKPGPLLSEEMAVIRRHPEDGVALLAEPLSLDEHGRALIRHHHERWDGSGYPDGLAGQAIPRVARVMAVADAYDAMTTDRPYRGALAHSQAMAELETNADRLFDPEVVAAWRAVHEVPDSFVYEPTW